MTPLGISSFTTLVVDESGAVIHRDRPDRPGYVARIRAVLGMKPLADAPIASFDTNGIERVVRAHASEVKRACWEKRLAANDPPASTSITAPTLPNVSTFVTSDRTLP